LRGIARRARGDNRGIVRKRGVHRSQVRDDLIEIVIVHLQVREQGGAVHRFLFLAMLQVGAIAATYTISSGQMFASK
jgi:hypothetical protein